jgi:SAM-dependent methyltransferase
MQKQWYEKLFENYSEKYDKEVFTQGTSGECDFIEAEIGGNKHLTILDVGCGTGRHTIELSKRGYTVTGVDLSANQLASARKKAKAAGLKIDFHQMDARKLPFSAEFDVAIMLCEGGFSLMETDAMNFAILESVSRALKQPCKFIFTALNGLFPLYHSVEEFHRESHQEGNATYGSNSFNLMTFRDHSITEVSDDDGKVVRLESNERYYVPSEIHWLLSSLAFSKIEIYGAKLGAYSRNDKLTTEDFEMLVIAEKE